MGSTVTSEGTESTSTGGSKGGGSSSVFLTYLILVSGLGGLLAGVDYGIIAGALLYLDKTIPMTAGQEGFMVSIYIFGGVIASLFAGTLADLIGRKKMMITAGVMFVVSILLIFVSSGYASLLSGRILMGLSGGVICVVVPALYGGMPARPRPGARHLGLPAPDDAWLCAGGLHRHALCRCA